MLALALWPDCIYVHRRDSCLVHHRNVYLMSIKMISNLSDDSSSNHGRWGLTKDALLLRLLLINSPLSKSLRPFLWSHFLNNHCISHMHYHTWNLHSIDKIWSIKMVQNSTEFNGRFRYLCLYQWWTYWQRGSLCSRLSFSIITLILESSVMDSKEETC